MFILDGRPLAPDTAFTATNADGDLVQYPANWLRLSTAKDRKRVGITEEPDPAPYDQRFFWGPDLPKDHTQLVDQWTQQTRTTAGTLLAPTDWQVIREADNGTPVPADIKTWREAIRTACTEKCDAIATSVDTVELAAYITGADYPTWPRDPASPAPAEPAPADGLEPAGNGSEG